jgi:RNA polymerase sigma-70 factor (ECF subfamily)
MSPVKTLCKPEGPRAAGDDPEVGLMLRVQGGDAEAFTALTRRYLGRMLAYFRKRLGDRVEAEDLAQEVFLRLYRSRGRYQPRARLSTWVFHIARNVARNAVRFRQRHPEARTGRAGNTSEVVGARLPDRGEGPWRPLERVEVAAAVRRAVADLGRRQRRAVELHQLEDRTYGEVAAALAMSPKAAKSLLYRARNQLRRRLAPLMG